MEQTGHTHDERELQRTMRPEAPQKSAKQTKKQQQIHHDDHVVCPHCGAENEAEAGFCANCGEPLHVEQCPNCGAAIDSDTDYCEHCHHYIRPDVCSFCGSKLTGGETYCPECGSPKGGIVCPRCHTLNDFAFCRTCGEPLTADAVELMKAVQSDPDYMEMLQACDELARINNTIAYTDETDRQREKRAEDIRQRVLQALAKDRGEKQPEVKRETAPRMNAKELASLHDYKLKELTAMLDKLAAPAQKKPAKVRNYAMATKPQGVRVAWECNWKHALHSSPCACAKPQMGGHWVMLGADTTITDDK